MPAPAIPRRAAPPRRKQAPPPPPPEPESEPALAEPANVEAQDSVGDTPASEVAETDNDATPAAATVALPVEKDEAVPDEETEPILEAATSSPASTGPSASPTAQTEDSSPYDAAIKVEPPTPHVSAFDNTQSTAEKQEEVEVEDELGREEPRNGDEESPEERRKRIAEKLKEMGAVNPLAGRLGEPAQPETAAAESDAKMDVDAQKAIPISQNNQYVHGHYDEDGSEVDYPGGSVASPTSPTRTAPFPPVSMSVPPPPLRSPVEVEKEHEGKDGYKAHEVAEEEGKVSSATDVDGDDEFKTDVQVLLSSRQWAEDGDEGEGKHLCPSFRLTASLIACFDMNLRLEHIPPESRDVHT